jgi:hypothetical protein
LLIFACESPNGMGGSHCAFLAMGVTLEEPGNRKNRAKRARIADRQYLGA